MIKLRHLKLRGFCASAVDAFQDKLERGLGVPARLRALQAPICEVLFARGWCTVDGLLAEEHARGARAEAASLFRQGGYSRSYSLVEETGVHVHVMHCDVITHARSPWLLGSLS